MEERQNEDKRVQEMLKQDLKAYSSLLKQRSLSPNAAPPRDSAQKRLKPPSLYPEESREILDDTEVLEESLSSAFSKLRKK